MPVIEDAIKKEKWDDLLYIVQFLEKNDLNEAVEKVKALSIPENIHEKIFGFIPNDDISVDELINHILISSHPVKDKELFQKLFEKHFYEQDSILFIPQ